MVRIRSLSNPKPDQATEDNPYGLDFPDSVRDQLSRIKKKDKALYEQLTKRFKKLQVDPECGETLGGDKAGCREVHVRDHWVIVFKADHSKRTVVILNIGIHDKGLGIR